MPNDICAYFIVSPTRRIDASLFDLLNQLNLNIEFVPAVFLSSAINTRKIVDHTSAYLRCGRTISNQEIGIAVAHRNVYLKFIREDFEWALVFEDDANLGDYSLLRRQIEYFMLKSVSTPSVYLLYHDNKSNNFLKESDDLFAMARSTPSFAVAYLLNKSAALQILHSQMPISSVADWPVCTHRVNFWLSRKISVIHGSEEGLISSHVAEEIRVPKKHWEKFRWIFFVDGIRLRQVNLRALHRHYCFVLLPRFINLVNRYFIN